VLGAVLALAGVPALAGVIQMAAARVVLALAGVIEVAAARVVLGDARAGAGGRDRGGRRDRARRRRRWPDATELAVLGAVLALARRDPDGGRAGRTGRRDQAGVVLALAALGADALAVVDTIVLGEVLAAGPDAAELAGARRRAGGGRPGPGGRRDRARALAGRPGPGRRDRGAVLGAVLALADVIEAAADRARRRPCWRWRCSAPTP